MSEFPKRKLHREAGYRGGRPIEDPSVVNPSNVANYFYDDYEVKAWFKRCLNDKPSSLRVESGRDFGYLMAQWVDRWFLQFSDFIEKGDKDESV